MTFQMMLESYFLGHQVCEAVWPVFLSQLVLRLDLAESSVRMDKRKGEVKRRRRMRLMDGREGELP